MRPISGQNPEAVLGQTLTNIQKILWTHIFTAFRPIIIEPYYFGGTLGVNELSVYNANKLYYALLLRLSGGGAAAPVYQCSIYDEANNLRIILNNAAFYWDANAAAARAALNTFENHDLFFSRLTVSGPQYIEFVGYRITY